MNKISKITFILCFFVGLLMPAKAQNDFEIAKNVDIFVSILKELNAKYTDEISPGDLVTTAITCMLADLDPYTVYFTEAQVEDSRIMVTGQYGGIGALIQKYGNHIVISEPYEGCPAHKAGLQAGDRILKINGQTTTGKNDEDVIAILRGQPGTIVTIDVERPANNQKLTFNVKREEIKFPTVPYFGMLKNNVGYIKLDQFTDKASAEVKEAFLELRKQEMKYLILDLRNNGGGLLTEAVNIMNIFVDPNILISETKGKIPEQNNVFKTRFPVIDREIPVVVLVNEFSASASEIVAGAFQDLDRGVLVGKKTFGKGLVQNIVPLSYNTSLKITVSKYYIPSGRCIQNVDYFATDTLRAKHIPDSLAVAFKTKNGRTVYDKGGIEPDIITPDTMASNILQSLIINNIIFDFANEYSAKHKTIAPARQFTVDQTIYDEFLDFLKTREYAYDTETEALLKDLKEIANIEQYFPVIENLYNEMLTKIENDKAQDIHKYRDEISNYIANEVVARYYFQKGRIENLLNFDPDIETASAILLDKKRYNSILQKK